MRLVLFERKSVLKGGNIPRYTPRLFAHSSPGFGGRCHWKCSDGFGGPPGWIDSWKFPRQQAGGPMEKL